MVNINQDDAEININKCLLSVSFSIICGGEFQELQINRALNMETDGRNCSFATGICSMVTVSYIREFERKRDKR